MAKKKFTFEPHKPFMRPTRFGTRFEIPAMLLFCTLTTMFYFKPKWDRISYIQPVYGHKNLLENFLTN